METQEAARLGALRKYRILDTAPEEAFDDLTLLASQVCGVPIALISLVDEDRQWFKSRVGVAATETARSISLCTHAIEQPDLFIVEDTLSDDRFRDNALVTGAPHIRFYAGAPLLTRDGFALGTLCVIDRIPRTLAPAQLEALQALRRQAEAQLELRLDLIELRTMLENEERLGALVPYCSRCEFNVIIPASLEHVGRVRDGVADMLAGKRWSAQDIEGIELALDEALTNAVRHGCRSDPTKEIQCLVSFDEAGDILVVVRDPGSGFDPASVPDPLEPDNLLKPGGRGVFLINQLMDSVEFSDEGRQVSMRRRRSAAGGDGSSG